MERKEGREINYRWMEGKEERKINSRRKEGKEARKINSRRKEGRKRIERTRKYMTCPQRGSRRKGELRLGRGQGRIRLQEWEKRGNERKWRGLRGGERERGGLRGGERERGRS